MKYYITIMLCFLLLNCKNLKKDISEEKETAQFIIEKSMNISGSKIIEASTIEFDFRDKHYKAFRGKGIFQLERIFTDNSLKYFDTITQITDIVNNNRFMRLVNGLPMSIQDSMAVKYSASVNSVHYFSVLPFGLNDAAVNKMLLEDILIKNKTYYTIKVTFNENGGGEDFEDIFMYWINKETHKVDYLAYSYNESDGKGIRFREAYNERFIKGIRFVDYNNFKPEDSSVLLNELPQLFEKGNLKLLSKIKMEDISVAPN